MPFLVGEREREKKPMLIVDGQKSVRAGTPTGNQEETEDRVKTGEKQSPILWMTLNGTREEKRKGKAFGLERALG